MMHDNKGHHHQNERRYRRSPEDARTPVASKKGRRGKRNIRSTPHYENAKHNINRQQNGHIRCLLLAAVLYVASLNYSYNLPQSTPGKVQQRPAVPLDEKAEHFFRTGKLPGSKLNEQRGSKQISSVNDRLSEQISSVNGLSKQRLSSVKDGPRGESKTSPNMKQNMLPQDRRWPPISSLIDATGNIADSADISGLLDFSIVGFPKTGTTSVLRHLSDLTNSLPKEHCELVVNDTAKLVRAIYDDHDKREKQSKAGVLQDDNQLRGIKCPQDISSEWSMYNYAKHFPRTKLVVGIRHPIFWFQSLYNFRVTNVPWKKMLPTAKLTRGCPPGSQGVCAWRASFHDFLARLGKTPGSKSELKLLSLGLDPLQSKEVGPVFIYDLSQLSQRSFREDLREFLGLSNDIPPFPLVDTSGRFDHIAAVKTQTDKEKIDICGAEHDAIRSALLIKAQSASKWIRDYFLKSPEVHVSNRKYFEATLRSWMKDPCG